MVQGVIEQHLPYEQFQILKEAEKSERELLRSFVAQTGVAPEGDIDDGGKEDVE
jgi:hypothetical protein